MNPTKLIFCILILFFRCSEGPPPEPLEPDLFVKIYTEAVIQTLSATKQDSLFYLKNALSKYEITLEEFDQNIEYYRGNPELWSNLFTKIAAELEVQKTKE